jgi:hypothetical protein
VSGKNLLLFRFSRVARNATSRAIVVFQSCPKLFEKIVCRKLTPVIRPRISDSQHGFLKGRSTTTNLIEFSSFIFGEIENGRFQGF